MSKSIIFLSIVILLSSCQSLIEKRTPRGTILCLSLTNDLDYPILVESNFPCMTDNHFTELIKNTQKVIEPDSTANIAHCRFELTSMQSDKEVINYILEYYPEAAFSIYIFNEEKGDQLVSIPFKSYFDTPLEWIEGYISHGPLNRSGSYVYYTRNASCFLAL